MAPLEAMVPRQHTQVQSRKPEETFSKAFNCLPLLRDFEACQFLKSQSKGSRELRKLRFGLASVTLSVKRGLESQRV